MSIIYDALQKTQRNRANSRDVYQQLKINRRAHWMDLGLLTVILILLVMVFVAYFPRLAKHFKTSSHVAVHSSVASAKLSVPVNTQPSEEAATQVFHDNLILNGVLLSDQEKMALINNKVFHQGDFVDGMRLIDIELDKVKLQDGERILVLRTSS